MSQSSSDERVASTTSEDSSEGGDESTMAWGRGNRMLLPNMYEERYHLAYNTFHQIVQAAELGDRKRFVELTGLAYAMLGRIDRRRLHHDDDLRFYNVVLEALTRYHLFFHFDYTHKQQ